MTKNELLDIILDLPANMREQLADEIYQSVDSAESGLNADWIVEANHLMRKFEDIPPPMPEEESSPKENEAPPEASEDNQAETLFELIDNLHLHCTIRARTKSLSEEEGIPSEEAFREIRKRQEQREELLGDLEVPSGSVPDVTAVRPLDDFKLHLTFENGEQRIFDVKPYRKGIFSGLQDPEYFSWARTRWGGVRWPNRELLGAKRLYHNSVSVDE